MNLNEQQEKAANHVNGPCLVTACPGSGKTRTVVERTVRLIKKGVEPGSIMCITFTNKAANEMKDRIEKELGDIAKPIWISTFHKLGMGIIRRQGIHLGYKPNLTICDPDDQIDLVSQCARQLGHEFTRPLIKKIVWHVNDARENLESDAQMEKRFREVDENFYSVAVEYLARLKLNNQTDLTGILSETVRLLTEHPEVLTRIQNRFKYFMVDETQDTNIAQFKMVELLASHTKNIFVVGDLDQSIYSWRGAKPENLTDFRNNYPDATIIRLGKNYRSTPQIVAVADKLIRHNTTRICSEFETDNDDGDPVICKSFETQEHESRWVASAIRELVAGGRYSRKDIAVFYRINSMSRSLEMAMLNQGIEYNVIGNFSFFDRKEVKDAIAMIRFLLNPNDGIAFHRIANKPKRYIGDAAIGKIELYAKANTSGNIIEACKDIGKYVKSGQVQDGVIEVIKAFDFNTGDVPQSPADCLTHLLQALRYDDYLQLEPETYEDRKENLNELVRDAARFYAEGKGGVAAYLESVSLMTMGDEEENEDAVSLMSLHASKGLEFPVVFMVGVEDGILPHTKAVEERDDGLEEERRLCYVGMTRAKKLLALSYCRKRMQGNYGSAERMRFTDCMPSQFLMEAGLIKHQARIKFSPSYHERY